MADEEIVIQMHTFSSEELEILKTSLLVTGEQLLSQILNECPRLMPRDCMMHLLHGDKEVKLEQSLLAQGFNEASPLVCVIAPASSALQSTVVDKMLGGEDMNALEQMVWETLGTLEISNQFNQSLDKVALPGTLQTLIFGYDFNQSLDNIARPEALQTLTFGHDFNQSLDT